VLLGIGLALLTSAVSRGAEPDVPSPDAGGAAPATARWEAEIADFERQDAKSPPAENGILFVGSSSIRLWKLGDHFADLPVINRGFGGSELADSVHFAPRIVLPYRPRTIVLYAGDNDLARGKSPEMVREDFEAFTRVVHEVLPETRIVFISIKPSPQRWALRSKMRAANQQIRAVAERDPRITFVNVASLMLGADGEPRAELFQADGLHLSAAGYRLWSSLLRPHLE